MSPLNKHNRLLWRVILLTGVLGTRPVVAQPLVPATDGTGTTVTPVDNRFDINGGTRSGDGANLFHSFEKFNLDSGQIANFLSNPQIRNILTRIVGGEASLINGLIQVTGGNSNLFLLNPAGLIFGPNASLNVPASFSASTATGIGFAGGWFQTTGVTNFEALVGPPNRFNFATNQPGSLINAGHLAVAPGQNLTLMAGTILNTGTLTAPGGNLSVVAVPGQNLVRVSATGMVLSLEVNPVAEPASFTPLKLPELLAGVPQLTATGVSVNPDGTISLIGSPTPSPTSAGTTLMAGVGDVSAAATTPFATGGTLQLLGNQVALFGASLNASGFGGGGSILIGGDFQGQGLLPQAQQTFVDQNTQINADALTMGNGGRVIVWSEGNTRFGGSISARGGTQAGNGGFVEVSGQDTLQFAGRVDTRAPLGQAGMLLLDPKNILIDPSGLELATGQTFASNPTDDITISGNALDLALTTTSVTLQANNDITINDNVISTGPGNGLSLQAGRSIIINANQTISLQGGDFSATINDPNALSDRDPGPAQFLMNPGSQILTNGGNVTIQHGDRTTLGESNTGEVRLNGATLDVGAGTISITGTGRAGIPLEVDHSGITLNNATLTSANSITLIGRGGTDANSNHGIFIQGSSLLSTSDSGTLTLQGTGGPGAVGANQGIQILDIGTQILTVDGNITLTGTSSGTAPSNSQSGISIANGAIVQSSGNGTLFLEGTGGNGAGDNIGVEITGNSQVSATNGTLTVTGTGGNGVGNNIGLAIANNSQIASTNGNLTLIGTGGAGFGTANTGLLINANSTVRTAGNGTLTLAGTGGNGTGPNLGLAITGNSQVASTVGNLTLTGISGNGIDGNIGILIADPGSNVASGNGTIQFTGTSNGTGANNVGIELRDSAAITAPDGGTITLSGKGGNGTDANSGIRIVRGGAAISATNGEISLTGEANGTGVDNSGIEITSGTLSVIGSGNLSLTGVGGSGTDANYGIRLLDAANITGGGNIRVTGLSQGTGANNTGISLEGNTTVNAINTGTLSFDGTGGSGSVANRGVQILAGSRLNAVDGNITLTGTGTGTDNESHGIFLDNNAIIETTGTGNITLIATGSDGEHGIELNDSLINHIGNGNITLTADGIEFLGSTAIQGAGTLQLQPMTPTLGISVGGSVGDSRLNLTNSELAKINSGFSEVIIGRLDGTGTITLLQNATFNNPTTITGATTLVGPNQNTNWTISGINSGTLDSYSPATVRFTNIGNLAGGNQNDTFTLQGGGTIVTLNGGAGSNTLMGDNLVNTWDITNPNQGTLNGIPFEKIQNLQGGNENNRFNLIGANASIAGGITGGNATDTLDYSNYLGNVTVRLESDSSIRATGIGDNTNSIEIITANPAFSNLLRAEDGINNWQITGANRGQLNTLTFNDFQNLEGGKNQDTFTLQGGTVSRFDGGGGNNTLIGENTVNNWSLKSTNEGTLNGINFTRIQNLIGGSAQDAFTLEGGSVETIDGRGDRNSLTGNNISNTWNITGLDSGILNTELTFNNIADLIGGNTDDTFKFTGATAAISGDISGVNTTDTLDYSDYTGGNVTVNLNASLLGSATAIAGRVQSIERIIGNRDFSNTLVGENTPNTWTITGPYGGEVNGIAFSNIQSLRGGNEADNFAFQSGIITNIDGGLGNNTLTADNSPNNWQITGLNSGQIFSLGGDSTTTFNNIQSLVGGNSRDQFTLAGGTVSRLDGGQGNNTLIGDNLANQWEITADNSGTLNNTLEFINIGNLTGGEISDTFRWIGNQAGISGDLSGGGGLDTLDYSRYTANDVTISLGSGNTTGIGGSLERIETLIGNSAFNNTLRGENRANTWNLTGTNQGTVNAVNFSNFQNLVGGNHTDVFTLNGGTVSSIDGKGGENNLTANQSSDNNWNITATNAGTLNDLSFRNIQRLAGGNNSDTFTLNGGTVASLDGGSGNNTLTGENKTNSWNITGQNSGNLNGTTTFENIQTLSGGEITDTFNLRGGTVNRIDGGRGNNAIVGDQDRYTWTITGPNSGDVNGIFFEQISSLTGGSQSNTFKLTGSSASLSGEINGISSADTLDYSAYTAGTITVRLGNSPGNATAVQGRVLGIEEIIGNSDANNTLIGSNTANSWDITGNNSGRVNQINFSNFSNLVGGDSNDTFTLRNGTVATINGQQGNNLLMGDNRPNRWNLSNSNAGTLNDGTRFTNIGNLTGGNETDNFVFADGATLSGLINGGPGIDSLNYSAYTTPVTVDLPAGVATGTGSISNIEGAFPQPTSAPSSDTQTLPPPISEPTVLPNPTPVVGAVAAPSNSPTANPPTTSQPTSSLASPPAPTPAPTSTFNPAPVPTPTSPNAIPVPPLTATSVSPSTRSEVPTPPPTLIPTTPTTPLNGPVPVPLVVNSPIQPSGAAPLPAQTAQLPLPQTTLTSPSARPVSPQEFFPQPTASPLTASVPTTPLTPSTNISLDTAPTNPFPAVGTPLGATTDPSTLLSSTDPSTLLSSTDPSTLLSLTESPTLTSLKSSTLISPTDASIPIELNTDTTFVEPATPSSSTVESTPKLSSVAPSGIQTTEAQLSTTFNPTTEGAEGTLSGTEGVATGTRLNLLATRSDIESRLDDGNVEEAIQILDSYYGEELELYLGRSFDHTNLSLNTLQNKLQEMVNATKTKPAIIYTFIRSQQLDLILVPPTGTPIYKKVPLTSSSQLLEQVKELHRQIGDVTRRRTTSYLPAAQQLYQWIVAPLETELKQLDVNTLIFSMDTGLRGLPLAVLHDGQQFLVEKYSLALIPSLNLTDAHYASLQSTSVLAMGLSQFSDQSPLPAVPVEVQTIVQRLLSGETFLNETVTLNNLQRQRQKQPFGIIHIATHGQFQPGDPSNSYIQLWDGKLSLDRMQELQWNDPPVELLVLSACRTAVGDRSAELGFAGLAVQSGAKSALATLWYASDAGTLALMSEFYDALRKTPIKAEALRQAQIAMLRGNSRLEGGQLRGTFGTVDLPTQLAGTGTRELKHPYYWAGFTLIGSPW